MKVLNTIAVIRSYFSTPQAIVVLSILAGFIWALFTQDLSKLAE